MPLRFDIEWRITLATLVLLPLLVALGFWQLQRAEEKTNLEAEWQQRQASSAVPVEELAGASPDSLVYRRVNLQGRFLPRRYVLLDNRVHEGRFGYEVVGLLALESGDLALVNRGWIAGDPARQTLPAIDWPGGQVAVSGYLYQSPGEPYLLGEQDYAGDWPLRLQALEPGRLAERLRSEGLALRIPLEVRIDPGEPAALTANWQLLNASPEKHQGYAVQWFAMALVLCLFWLLRNSNLWSLIRRRKS